MDASSRSSLPKAWEARVSVAPRMPMPKERQNVFMVKRARPRAAKDALLSS